MNIQQTIQLSRHLFRVTEIFNSFSFVPVEIPLGMLKFRINRGVYKSSVILRTSSDKKEMIK